MAKVLDSSVASTLLQPHQPQLVIGVREIWTQLDGTPQVRYSILLRTTFEPLTSSGNRLRQSVRLPQNSERARYEVPDAAPPEIAGWHRQTGLACTIRLPN